MMHDGQPTATNEPALFDEPYPAPARTRRRRRSRTVWSPDQFLDPLVLLATAPLALFPERFPREAYLVAAAILIVPYAVRRSNSGRFIAYTPMLWPLLFLVVIVLPVSVYVAPAFWSASWPEFVRFVWGMAIVMGVVNWCAAGAVTLHRDGRQVSIDDHAALATAAWFGLGLAFTVVGLLALRATGKVPLLGDLANLLPEAAWLPQSVAQGLNANRVASIAVLFLPFALALALMPARKRRTNGMHQATVIAMIGLVAFFGGALLLTQSRSALLAGGVAFLLVSALAGRRGLIPLLFVALVAVAALDVFGPSGLVSTFSVNDPAPAADAAQPSLLRRIAADRNIAGRLVIWRRALHGIADDPLTGMGLAGFEARSQEPYPPMTDWQPDPDVVHAHNLFLQTGLDMGVPGMLGLLAVVAVAAYEVYALYIGSRSASPARFWAIGSAGALTAFLLYNMLDAVSVGARPAVAYWYLLGLIAGSGAALRAAELEIHDSPYE